MLPPGIEQKNWFCCWEVGAGLGREGIASCCCFASGTVIGIHFSALPFWPLLLVSFLLDPSNVGSGAVPSRSVWFWWRQELATSSLLLALPLLGSLFWRSTSCNETFWRHPAPLLHRFRVFYWPHVWNSCLRFRYWSLPWQVNIEPKGLLHQVWQSHFRHVKARESQKDMKPLHINAHITLYLYTVQW